MKLYVTYELRLSFSTFEQNFTRKYRNLIRNTQVMRTINGYTGSFVLFKYRVQTIMLHISIFSPDCCILLQLDTWEQLFLLKATPLLLSPYPSQDKRTIWWDLPHHLSWFIIYLVYAFLKWNFFQASEYRQRDAQNAFATFLQLLRIVLCWNRIDSHNCTHIKPLSQHVLSNLFVN